MRKSRLVPKALFAPPGAGFAATALALLAGGALAACANSNTEYKSTKENLAPAAQTGAVDPLAVKPIDVGSFVEFPADFARFHYKVAIRSLLGIKVCDVDAEIHVSAAPFGFRVPAGRLKCLLGLYELDLASMLASMQAGSNPNAASAAAAAAATGPKIIDGLKSEGPLAKAVLFNGGRFLPDRPLFLSPFSLKRAELASYTHKDQAILTDMRTGQQAAGTFTTKVTGVDKRYKPAEMPEMKEVVTFEIKAEDFKIDGVQNPLFGIFEYMRFGINLNAPVALTQVEIKGNLRQFLHAIGKSPSSGIAGLASGWVTLRAQLDLVGQAGLNSSSP